jgi:hypothetical protein
VRSSTTPTTAARTSSPAPNSKVDTSRLSRVPADYGGPHSFARPSRALPARSVAFIVCQNSS